MNAKKATGLLQGAGLQLPSGLFRTDGYIHSIRDSDSSVKSKFENVTKRLTVGSVDPENVARYQAKLREWSARLDNSTEDGIIILHRGASRKNENIGVFSNFGIPMQKRAVLKLCAQYGVSTEGLTIKIQRDENLLELPFCGSADYDNIGRIDLFPKAFTDEEQLIKTILHEKCHVLQLQRHGKEYVQDNLEKMEKQQVSSKRYTIML